MTGLPDLSGKVAVVTGGASGIGKGTALRLTEAGMRVVIADIQEDALYAAARELGATPVHTDVSDLASVEELAKRAVAEFGTVHVVCNNAGVGPMAPVRDLTIDDWHWVLGVNLYGVIHGVQTFLPILEANADGGHIVNTASMAGLAAPPMLGAYSVAKFGVVALSEVLAAELAADGSRVGATVLCPGTVHTNIGSSSRNRPAHLAPGGLRDVVLEDANNPDHRWITAEDAGDVVVGAIRRGDLYALTHPELLPRVEHRHETIAEAFRSQSGPVTQSGTVSP